MEIIFSVIVTKLGTNLFPTRLPGLLSLEHHSSFKQIIADAEQHNLRNGLFWFADNRATSVNKTYSGSIRCVEVVHVGINESLRTICF